MAPRAPDSHENCAHCCCRSPPIARPAHRAGRVRAGIRTRTRGNPPREKRFQHFGHRALDDLVPPVRRCRAGAAFHSGLGMNRRREGCARYAPLWNRRCKSSSAPRGPARSPSMSRHPARRGFPLQRVVSPFERVGIDMMQERGEPLFLLEPRARRARVETVVRAFPARVRSVPSCSAFSSASVLGSTGSSAGHRPRSPASQPAPPSCPRDHSGPLKTS